MFVPINKYNHFTVRLVTGREPAKFTSHECRMHFHIIRKLNDVYSTNLNFQQK